jgi:hypothetical protein
VNMCKPNPFALRAKRKYVSLKGPAGNLDSISRSPIECNAVDMPGSAAAGDAS